MVSLSCSQYICLAGFDLLGSRVHELIVLPERRLRARKLDPLFHEHFAVNILEFDQDLPDEILPLPVGEDLPVEIEDGNIEIAIMKATGLRAEFGVGLFRPCPLILATAFFTMEIASSLL